MSDSVTDTTIITNTADFLIDTLTTSIADPVTNRTAKVPNSQFVTMKYAGVPLLYPCITVHIANVTSGPALGAQTEAHVYQITAEIEVYAKKTPSRADTLAQTILNTIRTFHYGTDSAISKNLWNPVVLSVVPIVEEIDMKAGGFEKIHRRIITVRYQYTSGGGQS